MNYPKTADEMTSQRAIQAAINDQIEAAFDEIVRIGYKYDPMFWDDYLHAPRAIDGLSTDERWNENTLRYMQDDILNRNPPFTS